MANESKAGMQQAVSEHSTSPAGTPRLAPTWERWVKRGIDFTAATVGLVVTAPVVAAVAGAIATTMGRPVFFRQVRAGFRGQPLRIWKFRTMTNERGRDGQLLPDGDRLTRLGRFLREHSLDELPQLINVLSGEMSLVGPRPLLLRYLPRYSARQMLRHEAKPGITGWAQISGRNALDWDHRLELDVWYVEHQSLLLDLRILALTAWSVLRSEGVFAGAGAELAEFWGSAGPPGDVLAYPVEEDERASVSSPVSGSTGHEPRS